MANSSQRDLIRENIKLHEQVATRYNDRHPEIYNPIEQSRLHNTLAWAVEHITSGGKQVMDYGCGTGNLTQHLLLLGCHVTTADVTPSFVKMASKLDPRKTTRHVLNGEDLSEFPENTFDLIATYSVLHHIPDYLTAVKDMTRVLKPGGVLVIDHEASDEHYAPGPALLEFRQRTAQPRDLSWYARRLLSPGWWRTRMKQRKDPRYSEEGDIHVWPDDRIEWTKLRDLLERSGMEIIREESYLHAQSHYDESVFHAYADKCTDMHVLIGRKR